jgi:hypothetical protein
MLVETTNVIRQGIAAGKSLDDLKKQGFAEEWKSWGTGFIKTESWIETIYNNLTAKTKN